MAEKKQGSRKAPRKHDPKYKAAKKENPLLTLDPDDSGHILINGKPTAGTFDTDYNYPDVDQVYPRPNSEKITVKVDPDQLLQAVKTARVYAHHGSNVVQLHIADSVVVYARSEEIGESWNVITPLEVKRSGRPNLAIGFNADFMIDYLKHAEGPVTMNPGKLPSAPWSRGIYTPPPRNPAAWNMKS